MRKNSLLEFLRKPKTDSLDKILERFKEAFNLGSEYSFVSGEYEVYHFQTLCIHATGDPVGTDIHIHPTQIFGWSKEHVFQVFDAAKETLSGEEIMDKSISFIQKNERRIIAFFESEGYYCTSNQHKGFMRFLVSNSEDISKELRDSCRYIYHFSPKIYEDSIRTKGFEPRSGISLQYSEGRVYFFPGNFIESNNRELFKRVKDTVACLKHLAKDKVKGREAKKSFNIWTRYCIDLYKVPDTVEFFPDLEHCDTGEGSPIYTVKPVSADAIVDIKHFDVSSLYSGGIFSSGLRGKMVPLDQE